MITAANKSAHVAVRQAIRALSKPEMACQNQTARVAATVKVIAKGERTQPWPKVFLCHASIHGRCCHVSNWFYQLVSNSHQTAPILLLNCANCTCRYEWTSSNRRCEIHKVRGNNFSNPDDQNREDTTCCWRVTSSSGGSKSSKGGRRLDQVDHAPRRQVNRRTRGRSTGGKIRRHALRVGQKMDESNAWE